MAFLSSLSLRDTDRANSGGLGWPIIEGGSLMCQWGWAGATEVAIKVWCYTFKPKGRAAPRKKESNTWTIIFMGIFDI